MWEKLDDYESFKPVCQKHVVAYKEKVERTRIIEFMAGLNADFEFVRVQILNRERCFHH